MTRERIGRNDPCPCGSGKKYKRCCLAVDEREAAHQIVPGPEAEVAPYQPPANLDPHQIPALLRELARKSPAKERSQYERMRAELEPVLGYLERQDDITAASEAIAAHRAEYEELRKDGQAFHERTHALFAEERFVPFRFTTDDVRRAFKQVGQPPAMGAGDRFVEVVRAAILHLADSRRRKQWSVSLLLNLPDYVAAGRLMDAAMIEECAFLTEKEVTESNAFLFEMFTYGYNAWAAEQRAGEAAILRELGLDRQRLEGMTMDEIDAWLQAQEANPQLRARLKQVLRADPAQEAQARVNFEAMRHDCTLLLERDDAAGLLLSPDEIAAYVPRLNEGLASLNHPLPNPADPDPDPAAGQELAQAIWPVFSEMAGAIFTAERRRQLVALLKTYRNARYAAGDKQIAAYAQTAMTYVAEEDEPELNRFLVMLCFTSLARLPDLTLGAEPEG